jgi:hypothetical protein
MVIEIQIGWVVYHIMCGYVACVTECRGSVCCAESAGKHKSSLGAQTGV